MSSFLSCTVAVTICHAYSRFCLPFVAYLEIRPFCHSNSSTQRSVRCKNKQTLDPSLKTVLNDVN